MNTSQKHSSLHPKTPQRQIEKNRVAQQSSFKVPEMKMLTQVIEAKRKAWGPTSPTTIESIIRLSCLYLSYDQQHEATTLLQNLLDSMDK